MSTRQFDLIAQSIFRFLGIYRTSYKLAFILVVSIIIPMIIFAYLSLSISLKTDFYSVSQGNQKAALRTAEQIEQYIKHNISLLESISENIVDLHLTRAQKETVINNHVLRFKEFERIILTDHLGKEIATSEMGGKLGDRSGNIAFQKASQKQLYFSDVYISESRIPAVTIALPYTLRGEFNGVIIADLNLVNMWRLVDSLTIGKHGYALVVSKDGLLIAHGKGDSKPSIVKNKNLGQLKIVEETFSGKLPVMEYKNRDGVMTLGVAALVKDTNWYLIIEQPLSEAYAPTYEMGKRLVILGIVILIAMSFIAYVGVDSAVIKPLKKLTGGIKEKGMFIDSGDEFSGLEKYYSFMTYTMSNMKDTIEKYSKSAKPGKLDLNLIHDLKIPIANIIRITRYMARQVTDKKLKKLSEEVMVNASKNIDNIISEAREPASALPSPGESADINIALNNQGLSFQERLKERNIQLNKELNPLNPQIKGKPFHLERVIYNLINNAIDAMDNGGTLTLSSKNNNGSVTVSVSDTGRGIENDRAKTIFIKPYSTKKEGWGVGLNGSKELVENMGGTINVESIPGKGSTFTLYFKSL